MNGWPTIPFEELYAEPSRNGLTRPKRVRGSGYKMVNMGEIFAYDRIQNPPMDLVPMNEAEQEKYSVQAGDLLFARQSLVAAGAGKCSIILEAPETTTFESHLIRIRLEENKSSQLFYYYYFSSPLGKDNVQSLVMQVAAAGIRGSELARLKVPKPPLSTQRKIASILATYDDLIENNTRRIEILEEIAQAIYREWFVNFRFPGHEKVKMVESELGPIPEVWEVKSLDEVCSIVMGQSPKSEYYNETGNGLPFHQGVSNFGRRFPVDKLYCTVDNRVAEAGDILFSVRAPVGRINLANKKLVIGRGLSAIRDREQNQAFTLEQLKDRFREEDSMGGGTIFKAVTKSEMLNLPLLQPEESLVRKFELILSPVFKELENLTTRNTNLRNTRDLLLPKLVSGDVGVDSVKSVRG